MDTGPLLVMVPCNTSKTSVSQFPSTRIVPAKQKIIKEVAKASKR